MFIVTKLAPWKINKNRIELNERKCRPVDEVF